MRKTPPRMTGAHACIVMPLVPAELAQLGLLEPGMVLDLVDGGRDLGEGEQLLEVRHEEVAHADRADLPLAAQLLHRPPRLLHQASGWASG